MADPLTALGVAASVVQLADVVCRVSAEMLNFFKTIKDASEEMQRVRDTLLGVESATRNLHQYVAEHASSQTASQEHEVLPEVMTNLKAINAKLDILRHLTANLDVPSDNKPRPHIAIRRKIVWTYHKKSVVDITDSLDKDWSNLTIAMLALGLRNDLKSRNDIKVLQEALLTTSTHIQQQFNKQNVLAETALADCRDVKAEIQNLKALLDRQLRIGNASISDHGIILQPESGTEALPSSNGLHSQIYSELQRLLKEPEPHTHLSERLEVTNTRIQTLAELLSKQDMPKPQNNHAIENIGDLAADVNSLMITDTRSGTASGIPDILAIIIRNELQTNLKRLIEQSLDSTFRASLARILEIVKSEDVSFLRNRCEKDQSAQKSQNGSSSPEECTEMCQESPGFRGTATHCRELGREPAQDNIGPKAHRKSGYPQLGTNMLWRKDWTFASILGSMQITIKSLRSRLGMASSRQRLDVLVNIFSCQILPRGLSLKFTTGVDRGGYTQLCPAIATYRIVDVIHDFAGISTVEFIDLLKEGTVSPFDRSIDGDTVLHRAAEAGCYEHCKILISHGADALAEDWRGFTPLYYLYEWAFYNLVDHPLLHSPQLVVEEILKICWLLEDHGDDSELCLGPENDLFSCFPCPEDFFVRIREHSLPDVDEAIATWTSFMRRRYIDIDYQNVEGKTPLMRQLATYYEVNSDPRAVLVWLCVCGANVHARDVYGREVLHWAVDCCALRRHNRQGRIERYLQTESDLIMNPEWHEMVVAMISLLIRAGADIYAIDDYGLSVGMVARYHQTLPQLKESLQSTGILRSHFCEEHNLRVEAWLEERVRLHGAKRTAVDPKDLEIPSRGTIMRRRTWVPAEEI